MSKLLAKVTKSARAGNNKEEDEHENIEEHSGIPKGPVKEDIHEYDSVVLADQHKSLIWQIIKNIKVGTEIKHMQLPTFLLEPRSLLQKVTDNISFPVYLTNASNTSDPQERFLNVLRFYLSGWHIRPKGVKKPYNPMIGEIFKCDFSAKDVHGNYVAEQISHHPPYTAFTYYDVDAGVIVNSNIKPSYVRYWGNSAQTYLDSSLIIRLIGKNIDENYEASYPHFSVKGILWGALMVEVFGKVRISCKESGFSATIEFKTKGFFRGRYNSISGKVKKNGKTVYLIQGFWDGQMSLIHPDTKEVIELLDVTKIQNMLADKIPPPVEDQPENESRKVWAKVTEGILKKDDEHAWKAKKEIEERQRREGKEREEKHEEWIPSLFVKKSITSDGEQKWVYKEWDNLVDQMRTNRNL